MEKKINEVVDVINFKVIKRRNPFDVYCYNNKDITACYRSMSGRKWRAWADCIELYRKLGGFNGGVSSYNTFGFTYSFNLYVKIGGVVKMAVAVITKDNNKIYYY